MKRKLVIFGAVASAAVVAIVGVLFATRALQIVFWDLPENYRGWVVVAFEDPGCRDSESNSLYSKVRIQPSGLGCASFPYPSNWTIYRGRYIQSDGTRVGIGSRKPGNDMIPLGYDLGRKKLILFVGTEDEMEHSWNSEPKL